MSFHEIRLPEDIERGAVGGPEFKTSIVELASGYEKRNIEWDSPRNSFNIGYGIQKLDNLYEVIDFFYARRGRAYGFRFKDWSDYSVTDEVLAQDGSPTVQLRKQYTSGNQTYNRKISKPVASEVSLTRNGSAFTNFSLDDTTGLITLTADSSIGIVDATQTNPVNIQTDGAHGYSTGDEIYLNSISGMTQLNDKVYTITVVDTENFTLDGVDGTGYDAYSSGGAAEKHVQSNEDLKWSGEFDIPVRFDTDKLDINVALFNAGSLPSITIKEIRL